MGGVWDTLTWVVARFQQNMFLATEIFQPGLLRKLIKGREAPLSGMVMTLFLRQNKAISQQTTGFFTIIGIIDKNTIANVITVFIRDVTSVGFWVPGTRLGTNYWQALEYHPRT